MTGDLLTPREMREAMEMTRETAVEVCSLTKSFGNVPVLQGLSLDVPSGSVFARWPAERRRQDDHGADPRDAPRRRQRRGTRRRLRRPPRT